MKARALLPARARAASASARRKLALDFSDEGTLFVEADAACDLADIGETAT
jgi:hypothetical protein